MQPASTDINTVLEAAATLDIPEYKLFAKAYGKWFGRPPDEARLERIYLAYMFNGVVPPWVRDYSRQVLDNAAKHQLDPIKFGVLPVLTRRVMYGLSMLALSFIIVGVLIWIADIAADRMGRPPSAGITYRP